MEGQDIKTVTGVLRGGLTAAPAQGILVSADDADRMGPSGSGAFVDGVVFAEPKANQVDFPFTMVPLVPGSIVEVLSGGAITAGDFLTTNATGQAIMAGGTGNDFHGAGANTHIIGRAREAATAANQLITKPVVNQWVAA